MRNMIEVGDTIGLIACSNGLPIESNTKIKQLEEILVSLGLKFVYGNEIYRSKDVYNGTPKEKAEGLKKLFKDKSVKAIFDISGGDLANGVLKYLDFNEIGSNKKPFFGYSDLSVLLNPLHDLSGIDTYYYQLRNLVGEYKEEQLKLFKSFFFEGSTDLLNFNYKWIRGKKMSGEIVGGNIRCFLKLAGTNYMGDFKDKILFLESLGGDVSKITTCLTQYEQLDVFKNVKGIILGSFSEMEEKNYTPKTEEILLDILGDLDLPIIKTNELGHGQNSKSIAIGKKIKFMRE
ncbi:S66 peptidase family protein [Clostridium intestinale]|uniref:S66 family peptidase n=1 Tax=Clostridium intestinale TaxID=36845 RepID=UPI002DD6196C|nr:S66 peptidase family protein [Clostridium intestinale]WRY51304.1 LD-carboxypeptidase [Clostridium intestinale]